MFDHSHSRIGALYHRLALTSMVSVLGCTLLVLGWTSTPAWCQSYLTDQADYLQTELQKPDIRNELDGFTPLHNNDANDRLVAFKSHLINNSRYDYGESVPLDNNLESISMRTQRLIKQALTQRPGTESRFNAKAALMGIMSQERAWRTLEALQYTKSFDAAAALAKAMGETETKQEASDLLVLIEARNYWLARAGRKPDYENLIKQAMTSQNPDVAYHARIWNEALTAPQSPESIILGHQIWQTVHIDQGNMDKSALLSKNIAIHGPRSYESLRDTVIAAQGDHFQLGWVLSIISEAGFQLHNKALIDWTVAEAQFLDDTADPEHRLTPQYFQAYNSYSRGDIETALTQFQDIFLTLIPCDMAAGAGLMASHCFKHMKNYVGAVATLEVAEEYYSSQYYVLEKIQLQKQRLMDTRLRLENSEQAVGLFLEDYYGPKIETAKANIKPTQEPGSTLDVEETAQAPPIEKPVETTEAKTSANTLNQTVTQQAAEPGGV